MVTHPVIGAISNMLWSFNSSSQGYIESIPQLQVLSHTIHCTVAPVSNFVCSLEVAKHTKHAFMCQSGLCDTYMLQLLSLQRCCCPLVESLKTLSLSSAFC